MAFLVLRMILIFFPLISAVLMCCLSLGDEFQVHSIVGVGLDMAYKTPVRSIWGGRNFGLLVWYWWGSINLAERDYFVS